MLRGAVTGSIRALAPHRSGFGLPAVLQQRGMASQTASRSRENPTEPRVGVGVVVLRELQPGQPETLLIKRGKEPNKGACLPGGMCFLGGICSLAWHAAGCKRGACRCSGGRRCGGRQGPSAWPAHGQRFDVASSLHLQVIGAFPEAVWSWARRWCSVP